MPIQNNPQSPNSNSVSSLIQLEIVTLEMEVLDLMSQLEGSGGSSGAATPTSSSSPPALYGLLPDSVGSAQGTGSGSSASDSSILEQEMILLLEEMIMLLAEMEGQGQGSSQGAGAGQGSGQGAGPPLPVLPPPTQAPPGSGSSQGYVPPTGTGGGSGAATGTGTASAGPGADVATSGPLKGLSYGAEIASAAAKYGLDPKMLYGQAIVESEGPGSGLTINPNVAGGIFQVTPGWESPQGEKIDPSHTGNDVQDQANDAAQADSLLIKEAGGKTDVGVDAFNSGNFSQPWNPAAQPAGQYPSYYADIEHWAAQISQFEGGS